MSWTEEDKRRWRERVAACYKLILNAYLEGITRIQAGEVIGFAALNIEIGWWEDSPLSEALPKKRASYEDHSGWYRAYLELPEAERAQAEESFAYLRVASQQLLER
jgi:hypothetical protein